MADCGTRSIIKKANVLQILKRRTFVCLEEDTLNQEIDPGET
jgi:hypothetical protein